MTNKLSALILTLLALIAWEVSSARVIIRSVQWTGQTQVTLSDGQIASSPDFEGAYHDISKSGVPVWFESIKPVQENVSAVKVFNAVYKDVSGSYSWLNLLDTVINVDFTVASIKKQAFVEVSLIPFRLNPETGGLQRLESFYYRVEYGGPNSVQGSGSRSYADHSVLSQGSWFKLGITEGGIYKIDYAFLRDELGLTPEQVNPSTIGVFGRSGGMLPEENSVARIDDLVEFPVQFNNTGSPSQFDPQDYILFFAEGPHIWNYEGGEFYHYTNIYSDKSFVFFTTSEGTGKQITSQAQSASSVTNAVVEYIDHYYHELEQENLIASGREWFGEKFSPFANSRQFSLSFPGLITSEDVVVRSSVAARGIGSPSSFTMSVNGNQVLSHSLSGVGTQYTDTYAARDNNSGTFAVSSNQFNLTYLYNSGSSSSTGWLDYFELNFTRSLTYQGENFRFKNQSTIGVGEVSEFTLSQGNGLTIWDITDRVAPKVQATSQVGSDIKFAIETEVLKEFMAFDPSSILPNPSFEGQVMSQDLHGSGQPDMVIVSPEEFLPAAQRLADFHAQELSVLIATPEQIYNEFSSGAQDISAIRDYMKMLYDRAGANTNDLPQYLLLFGDGSYDYKDRVDGNTNFVPTYQTRNSISPISSWTSDDYFGLLDVSEGGSITDGDRMDIGIGRIPATSLEEANQIVDKIYNYREVSTFGDWRNLVTFVGDDEDNNLHINSPEKMAKKLTSNYPVYNLDKIYFDAFRQQNTSAGDRYPSVTEAIINRVFSGSLIINYTGHGGINDWAHERVFSTDDIIELDNFDKLPVFVTATCDFSKYDDPENKTAGEYLLTNPNGGAIAMVTTVRLVYAYANDQLNNAFYDYAFEPMPNGEMPRLGDIMVETKNNIPIEGNNRKFTLLGDPALRMAYPQQEVVTTEINGQPVMNSDTLSALTEVTIRGEVRDASGNLLSGFNGVVYPTVFDKPDTLRTLKNDPESQVKKFPIQNSTLFKGKSSVVNGEFEFSFIVPKDINYQIGIGKISYYAEDTSTLTDAHGYTNCSIGGASDSAVIDNDPPVIRVFMNDTLFMDGGVTDQNPVLLAILEDESGINTTGNGIGHDITAVLDGDQANKIILNNFYESELDNFRKGSVRYPLFNLEEGEHEITVKAWDVHNNSGEGTTTFIVAKSASLAIEQLMNYPNPFVNSTTFSFEHNRPNEKLLMTLRIFNSSGQLVSQLKADVQSKGYRVDGISWEAAGADLDNIGKGVYIYSILVETLDGERAQAFDKLVILR